MLPVPCYSFLGSCNISQVTDPVQLNLSTQYLSIAAAIATLCKLHTKYL